MSTYSLCRSGQWPVQSAPVRRRRPYSTGSSIKSIIHGPNIEDIEEELRKLELKETVHTARPVSSIRMCNGTLANPNNPVNDVEPTKRRASTASVVSHSVLSGYIRPASKDSLDRRNKQRPKTCAANFPLREKSERYLLNNLSRRSTAIELLPSKLVIPKNGGVFGFKIADPNETLAERHEWRIRGELEPQDRAKMVSTTYIILLFNAVLYIKYNYTYFNSGIAATVNPAFCLKKNTFIR